MVRARRPGAGAAVGNVLLTVAAIGGAVCIVFVLLAVFLNISLIMFKTGSMTPTISAGSLAIVKQVPAYDVRVGDIVTVDRPSLLPITHRVTTITPVGNGVVSITMRGDANPAEDPAPYLVSSVRIVLFSVPQLAYVVNAMSNPLALGGITMGVAGIVTWAFWPRDAATPRPRRILRHRVHAPRTPRHARAAGVLTILLAAGGSAAVLPSGTANAASSAVTEEIIVGTSITLNSIGDRDAMSTLVAGVPVDWQVGVTPHPAEPGIIAISLVGSGGLMSDADGLWLSIKGCQVRWIGGICSSGQSQLVTAAAASSALASPLLVATIDSTEQVWLMISAFLPAASGANPVGVANLALVAAGSGDAVSAGTSPGAVAYTGADISGPVRAALAAVLAGLALAFLAQVLHTRQGRR